MAGKGKRVLIALGFSLFTAFSYVREYTSILGGSPDTTHMALLIAIVSFVFGGIYVAAPTAQKIEYRSMGHIWRLTVALMLFPLGVGRTIGTLWQTFPARVHGP